MEQREILVANTKTQRKYKVITDATTLGELKLALSEAGIDYSGMTFTEGISKTQLIDDATQLPHDILYKGQPTNNLAILLTNTKKNIASGAMSRKEILDFIKEHDLKDEVQKRFGNNYTRVSSTNLLELIEEYSSDSVSDEEEETETEESDMKPVEEEEATSSKDSDDEEEEEDEKDEEEPMTIEDVIANTSVDSLENSLFLTIAMLVQKNILKTIDIKELKIDLELLLCCMEHKSHSKSSKKTESVTTSDGSISEDDIDDMIIALGI